MTRRTAPRTLSRLVVSRRARRWMVSTAAGIVGVALAAGTLAAQDGPNPLLTLTFGSTFTVDDNKDLDPVSAGTSSYLSNSVGLRYSTETVGRALVVDLGGVLRVSKDAGRDTRSAFDNQNAALSYSETSANSSFSLGLDYRESEVRFFDPLTLVGLPDEEVDTSDLVNGTLGTRTAQGASLQFETGIEGPLGLSFAASRRDRTYDGTTDPDYFDSSRTNLALGVALRPSKRTTIRLDLSQSDYSADDAPDTDRRSDRATIGIQQALRADTTLSFNIGTSRVRLDETIMGVRTRTEETGPVGSLGLSRDLVNGTIGLQLGRDISINGTQTSLALSREMDLPRGTLAFSLGPTFGPGDRDGVAGSLRYGQELPRGALRATLNRRIGTNDQNETVSTTRVNLGLSRDLSPLTGVDLSIDYLAVNSEVVGDDRERARLRLAYTVDLAQDWQLAGGYTHTYSNDETSGTAKSNEIFLSLERAFTFAP